MALVEDGRPTLTLLWRLTLVPAVLLALVVTATVLALLTDVGPALPAGRLDALWVLLASLLATIGGLVGALLAATTQERAHRLQQAAEAAAEADRAAAAAAEGARYAEDRRARDADARRRRLEASIHGVELLTADGARGPVVTAGALALIAELGEREVAVRMLGPALAAGTVDRDTAAWLIDTALTGDVGPDTKQHAALLLLTHAATFTSDEVAGAFSWPYSIAFERRWPPGLPPNAGGLLVLALTDVLTSRPLGWWTAEGGSWSWVLSTLVLAFEADTSAEVREVVAATSRIILDAGPEHVADHELGEPPRIEQMARYDEPLAPERERRLRAWLTGEDVGPSSGRLTPGSGRPQIS